MQKHSTLAALTTSLMAAVFTTGARAFENPLEKPHMSAPLEVCDQGSFFVGGVPKVTRYAAGPTAGNPEQITIGQAYVQFQVPKKRRKWPIVFVHGSTHTGAALDSTPDGHEGWHSYAVRNNLASFVMDQPGRGRSGFDHSVLHEAKATQNWDMIPTFGRITDNGAWTTWFGHIINGTTIVDGKMIRHSDPGDPDGLDDPKQPTPNHGKYLPKFPIPPVANSADAGIIARQGAIGPAPNPANNTFLALEYYKQLVPNAEVTLPGSICQACTPQQVAPNNTWLPEALADLLEGIGGGIVAPHSQSGPSVAASRSRSQGARQAASDQGHHHAGRRDRSRGCGSHGQGLRYHPVPDDERRLSSAGDASGQLHGCCPDECEQDAQGRSGAVPSTRKIRASRASSSATRTWACWVRRPLRSSTTSSSGRTRTSTTRSWPRRARTAETVTATEMATVTGTATETATATATATAHNGKGKGGKH